jgi:predicted outer membrane repeat protein
VSKFAAITASSALIGALFLGAPAPVYAIANDIYVGSNNDTSGASSCADPDFSTDLSDEASINAALDGALAAIDDDADTIIICDDDYIYGADISLHNGATHHDVINIESAPGAEVTLDGGDQWQLLSFANMTSVSITGIEFLDAQVENDGAAIQIMGGTLNVVDSSFTEGGTATDNGGAIYSEPGHVTISGSTFTGNRAGSEGGAIFVNNAADGDGVTVSDSFFTGNNEAEGAAISVNGAGSAAIISVIDSEFVDNDGAYGAITIDNGSVELTNVLMDGNNNTTGEGGAAYAEASLTVINSEFTNNSASTTGGALYNLGDTIVTGSLFSENVAGDDGGAIYADGDLEVTRSRFTDNSSGESDQGGAIAAVNCAEVLVSSSAFLRNTAGDNGGGAINIDCSASAAVLVSRNTFTENAARTYGGAIDQEGSSFVIGYVRNTFTGNSVTNSLEGSDGQGGAVWAFNANFSGNRFIRNSASDAGGAVYVTQSRDARSAKRSTFSGNRAPRGRDVFLSRSGD